jgi:hypothetical protein
MLDSYACGRKGGIWTSEILIAFSFQIIIFFKDLVLKHHFCLQWVPVIFFVIKGSVCARLTTHCHLSRLSRKRGSLSPSQPCGSPMTCSRDSFTFFLKSVGRVLEVLHDYQVCNFADLCYKQFIWCIGIHVYNVSTADFRFLVPMVHSWHQAEGKYRFNAAILLYISLKISKYLYKIGDMVA